MNKGCYIFIFILFANVCFSQNTVSTVYTDLNGYYKSTTTPASAYTQGSHNVIGFEWKNKLFSTGVNNDVLSVNNPNQPIINQVFKNFPTDSLAAPNYGEAKSARNGIGLGVPENEFANYTGYKQSDYKKYMSDGINGLDIGTGVFNINLVSGEVKFNNVAVNVSSINDGIPDILITQIGSPPTGNQEDKYMFRNRNNIRVGNEFRVAFSGVTVAFNTMFFFYELGFINKSIVDIDAILSYNQSTNINTGQSRPVRILALDWSDFGINSSNYTNIYSFVQLFSGGSDTAFIAYNVSSLKFLRTVSGTVKHVDKVTLDENVFPNADIAIFIVDDTGVERKIKSTKTDNKGYYEFKNLESNAAGEVYRVRLMNFENYNPKYFVVNNKNGKTLDYLDMMLDEEDSNDNHFILGKFCVGDWTIENNNPGFEKIILAPIYMTSHAEDIEDWVEKIPNSQLTLDSKTNGFVITRIDAGDIAEKDLVEGMLIYDKSDHCLKLYDGNAWSCIERDCFHLIYDQNKPLYP